MDEVLISVSQVQGQIFYYSSQPARAATPTHVTLTLESKFSSADAGWYLYDDISSCGALLTYP